MAKKLWRKMLSSIGVESAEEEERDYFEDEAEEEVYDEAYDEPYEEEQNSNVYDFEEPRFNRRRSKVIDMPDTSGRYRMIIFRPSSYEETQGIIDNLKSRKPVVVNLDEIDVQVAQRILDFISGAVYALGGDIRKAARNIFLVVPSNVDIQTNLDSADSGYDRVTNIL